MDLVVSIVSTNNRELLKGCLGSLYENPPSCNYGVWVVDNASADGTAEMLSSRFPECGICRSHFR